MTVAYKGLMLIFGLFVAYETRKIKVEAINDSKHIGKFILAKNNMAVILTVLLFIFTQNYLFIPWRSVVSFLLGKYLQGNVLIYWWLAIFTTKALGYGRTQSSKFSASCSLDKKEATNNFNFDGPFKAL